MNAKTTQPYVYRLTDKQTGKRYIGCRFAKGCGPHDLGVSYFTSSRHLQPLFKSDPSRFEKQIIVTGDKDYIIRVERSLIDMHDAVASEAFYNRTNAKAIHPDDIRSGALKEHAKRSPELYDSIVRKMHAKTTADQRKFAAAALIESLGPERLAEKMSMMRNSRTPEGKARSLAAMQISMNTERRSDAGKKGGKIGGPKACVLTNAQRWRCVECGMVSLPGPIGKHQSRSGHIGKERVV
jgi:hypothetical protein